MTDKNGARASHQALAVPVEPVSRLDPSGFDPSRIAELATRCETEEGPDRELDIEIVVAIDWREPEWEEGERTAREMAERHGLPWLISRSVEGYSSVWQHLPRFTASLDAALTLVPDGATWVLTSEGSANVLAPIPGEPGWFTDEPVQALTAPLAVCAAALKARAAIAMEAATAGETEGLDPKDDSAGRLRHRPHTPSLQTPQGGDS